MATKLAFLFRFLMSTEFEVKVSTVLDLLRSHAQLGSSFFYMQRAFSLFTKHQEVSLAGLHTIAGTIVVTVQQFAKVKLWEGFEQKNLI